MYNQQYRDRLRQWPVIVENPYSEQDLTIGVLLDANYCSRCGQRLDGVQYRDTALGDPDDSVNRQEYVPIDEKRKQPSSGLTGVLVLVMVIVFVAVSAMGGSKGVAASRPEFPAQLNSNMSEGLYSPSNLVMDGSQPLVSASSSQIAFEATPASNVYIVQPGDTVYRIALRLYGDGSRWVEIAQLNDLQHMQNGSVLIWPGQVLHLPE